MDALIFIGFVKAAAPRTTVVFAIFDPIMFPMAISTLPLTAAEILTTSSGNEVPNAIMIIPMIHSEIPKLFAISEALSTVKCAPMMTKIRPPRSIGMVLIQEKVPRLKIFQILIRYIFGILKKKYKVGTH